MIHKVNKDILKKLKNEIFAASDKLKREEIIDGVRIVHTGFKCYVPISANVCSKKRYHVVEQVNIYDECGNLFSSNFQSIKEAEEAIKQLADIGINAVIGPKAPYRRQDGTFVKNPSSEAVGLYIVPKQKVQLEQSTNDLIKRRV